MQDWEIVSGLAKVWPQIKEKDRLEKLLTEGKGGTMFGFLNLAPMMPEKAERLMEQAEAEFTQGKLIVRHRRWLHSRIEDALDEIRRAKNEISELDQWGDVEYEGGHADLTSFLDEAARQLRAAQAIKPSDKDGELK